MRKSVLVLILISVAFAGWAQRKKKGDKQEPVKQEPVAAPVKAEAPTPKDTVPPIDPFTRHYALKYSLAIKWNDPQTAKDALYDLIVENQGNDSIIYDLALYYYQNQNFASGVLVSQELLKRNPKNTGALEIAAVGYDNLGVAERALQSYESLYLLKSNPLVLYKMAFLQLRLKRYKEAITSADILLTDPAADTLKVTYNDAGGKPKEYIIRVALLYLKGVAADEQGDKATAKTLYSQAATLSPDFVPAKQSLAKLK